MNNFFFSSHKRYNQNLKFLHWASIFVGNLPFSALHALQYFLHRVAILRIILFSTSSSSAGSLSIFSAFVEKYGEHLLSSKAPLLFFRVCLLMLNLNIQLYRKLDFPFLSHSSISKTGYINQEIDTRTLILRTLHSF